MEVDIKENENFDMVVFTGRIDTNTSSDAQKSLDALITGGTKAIIVDFTALDFVSSAGLRVFLATAKKLSGTGRDLRLFGLNDTVQDIFDISGFSSLLNVFNTSEEALSGI
jgi:anti-sigma B factor antagonist